MTPAKGSHPLSLRPLTHRALPFPQVLIDNQGPKPRFWYSIGSSTPAIRWPDGTCQGESLDILEALDERFPDSPTRLLPTAPQEHAEALRLAASLPKMLPSHCRPSSRAAFLYRGSGPVPAADFEASLREMDRQLAAASGGPFLMGADFGLADAAWAPFLERYAVQLPLLHEGLCPRDGSRWPALAAWYHAMEESVPGYAARVQGDALSWAAVLAVAGYGNAGDARDYRIPVDLSFELGTSSQGQEVRPSPSPRVFSHLVALISSHSPLSY